MDSINKLMNILFPLSTLFLIVLLLPPYLVFKILSSIKRYIYKENVAGKVVIITGASSGIGEHLAYEYAKRGACLALVARREELLQEVAVKARHLGSPDVIIIPSDVSKVQDCKRFVEQTVNHFGRLDHLVNNAGTVEASLFEEYTQISDFDPIMTTNFWGSIYGTHFAIPHLRKNKGKIIVIASAAGWLPTPKLSIYGGSKAAVINFFETLRLEIGSDIGITIVTPGRIESDMTKYKYRSQSLVDAIVMESAGECAKAIVNGTCGGERYVTEPSWMRAMFVLKLLFPEIVEWYLRLHFSNVPRILKKHD